MTTPDPTAESLFARYLDGREGGESADFEALCAGHPDQAQELRQLLTDWREVRVSSLKGVGESVHVVDERSDPAAWQAFLERLRVRGRDTARYARTDVVGEGAMGTIERVVDVDLRRALARKVMKRKDGEDAPQASSRLGRFLEEAQVTAQLDHPGIVPVHELGIDGAGQVYFTMKLVKGEDLRAVFERVVDPLDEEWSETRALNTLLRVCEAMSYAHAKGVIHRDLKPANIMVGKYGEAYVMDFGLARVLGQADTRDLRLVAAVGLTSTEVRSDRRDQAGETPDSPLITMDGDVVGTPAYMPPEQASGRLSEIGPHSDVYAVGAMLYQLLTGRMPYVDPEDRVSNRMILARVQSGPPRPLRALRRDAPAELEAICEKAMSREIAARYPDMTALARDLRAYVEHRVVAAYESGPIAELKKWVVRNKGITVTAAVAVVVIAALTGWFVVNVKEKEQVATARKAEFDQLAGVVLLKEALAAEEDLYPAWPGKIDAMAAWLSEDAAELTALKPTLAQTLSDLEARALPWTAEDREQDRTTHPRYAELGPLSLRVTSSRRAQAVRDGREEVPSASLPAALLSADAKGLNSYAWPRVDWNVEKRIFGEEREALAAVRAALTKIEAGDGSAERASLLDTLSWALFANGLDKEAQQASSRALELASEEKKPEYEGYEKKLYEEIASAGPTLSALESDLAVLESELSKRRTWAFGEESQRFLHSTLSDLSKEISSFEEVEHKDVESRLSWARRIEELTLHHPNALHTWSEAHDALQAADGVLASELYREHPIDLKPQTGLVPIGMNPVTLLWEFYHLRSAWDPASGMDPADLKIPEHADDGSIEMEDDTGIVFVLIPGGTFRMGAQKTDPAQPNHDPQADSDESPVHEVTLDPYLLARHELTKGQWYRLSGGEEPSWYQRGTTYSGNPEAIGWTHAVEQVSWEACALLFSQYGLELPTEAQWERGARGGTSTAWWTGAEASTLSGAANVLDLVAEAKYPGWGRQEGDFEDGFVSLAPVGRFRANHFGLFDVHGNVWEWCRDLYGRYRIGVREGDGLRAVSPGGAPDRVYRGGSFYYPAEYARSADRSRSDPGFRYNYLGARPSQGLH